MMFEEEKFIDSIFGNCCAVIADDAEFCAEAVIAKTYTHIEGSEKGYWQKKNVTDSMNILEKMKLIQGRIQPEFTKNLGLTKEVRYGQITKRGTFYKRLPAFLRHLSIYGFRRKKSLLSILGVLSFIHLCRNALAGMEIVSGFLSYIAAAILLYLLYLSLKRLID